MLFLLFPPPGPDCYLQDVLWQHAAHPSLRCEFPRGCAQTGSGIPSAGFRPRSLHGRACVSLCCFSSWLPPQLLKRCHGGLPVRRILHLIPGKQKHFSKSLCWLGRETEIAFYQNVKGFCHSRLKRGARFISEEAFSAWQTCRHAFLSLLRPTRPSEPPSGLWDRCNEWDRSWWPNLPARDSCHSCRTALKLMPWVLRALLFFLPYKKNPPTIMYHSHPLAKRRKSKADCRCLKPWRVLNSVYTVFFCTYIRIIKCNL